MTVDRRRKGYRRIYGVAETLVEREKNAEK
jgi:hypothetical protein